MGSVVFSQHKIATYLFEKDFDQVSAIPAVINNQDAPFFFHRRPPTLKFRVKASLRRCPIGKYPRDHIPKCHWQPSGPNIDVSPGRGRNYGEKKSLSHSEPAERGRTPTAPRQADARRPRKDRRRVHPLSYRLRDF